ncbi:hypothetical protein BLNAU_12649 [Blattamonas nauphoetae]|uniref:Right handed beta helix domain-containing protein n=1 Tax=Blattamonas nauphoetae TaxID=2049346 RepID=A0ABQ9XIX6_9EUKA|nr:hypothetical protein BLNAU_12649 [Blattamonas nauphoetae]
MHVRYVSGSGTDNNSCGLSLETACAGVIRAVTNIKSQMEANEDGTVLVSDSGTFRLFSTLVGRFWIGPLARPSDKALPFLTRNGSSYLVVPDETFLTMAFLRFYYPSTISASPLVIVHRGNLTLHNLEFTSLVPFGECRLGVVDSSNSESTIVSDCSFFESHALGGHPYRSLASTQILRNCSFSSLQCYSPGGMIIIEWGSGVLSGITLINTDMVYGTFLRLECPYSINLDSSSFIDCTSNDETCIMSIFDYYEISDVSVSNICIENCRTNNILKPSLFDLNFTVHFPWLEFVNVTIIDCQKDARAISIFGTKPYEGIEHFEVGGMNFWDDADKFVLVEYDFFLARMISRQSFLDIFQTRLWTVTVTLFDADLNISGDDIPVCGREELPCRTLSYGRERVVNATWDEGRREIVIVGKTRSVGSVQISNMSVTGKRKKAEVCIETGESNTEGFLMLETSEMKRLKITKGEWEGSVIFKIRNGTSLLDWIWIGSSKQKTSLWNVVIVESGRVRIQRLFLWRLTMEGDVMNLGIVSPTPMKSEDKMRRIEIYGMEYHENELNGLSDRVIMMENSTFSVCKSRLNGERREKKPAKFACGWTSGLIEMNESQGEIEFEAEYSKLRKRFIGLRVMVTSEGESWDHLQMKPAGIVLEEIEKRLEHKLG